MGDKNSMGKLRLLLWGWIFLWPVVSLAWTIRCEERETCLLYPPDGKPAVPIRVAVANRIQAGTLSPETIYKEYYLARIEREPNDSDSSLNIYPTPGSTLGKVQNERANPSPQTKPSAPAKDLPDPSTWDPNSPLGPAPLVPEDIIAACGEGKDWSQTNPENQGAPMVVILKNKATALTSEKFSAADFMAADDPKGACELADAQELVARAAFAQCTGSKTGDKEDLGGPGEIFVLGMIPFDNGFVSRNYFSCANKPSQITQGEFVLREHRNKCYACGMGAGLLEEKSAQSFFQLKPFLLEKKLKPERKPRISPIESEGYDLKDFIRPYWIGGVNTIIWKYNLDGCVEAKKI